jgi:PAS domain S-box-containing protein
METILHAVQEGIVVVNGEGRITYANRAAEKMLGFELEKAHGDPISKYMRDIEWSRVLDLDEKEWSRLVRREVEITYPEHMFVAFYVVPLSAVNAEEEGGVVMLRDITRDREVEARTLENERMNALTLLAAGVAHEIGNPLNSLNIHLQLLERELSDLAGNEKESLGELVDVARKEVARLDQIINQFLRAIRPTSPNFEPASVADVLTSTLAFMKIEIQNRGVMVELEMGDNLPSTQIDKGQIRQAFFNVIRNAIQAMSDGGLLTINLSHTDRFVTVAFHDSGPGIEPDELGRVFEPYHTTKKEGSGLGLMVVQRIVRDHGGEIEIDSAPGQGTTVVIYLPRDQRRIRMLHAPRDKKAATDKEST